MQLILVFAILSLHSAIRPVASFDPALTLPSKFCVIDKVRRMLAYNCQDLRLKEVPQYMKSGVEVRDCSGGFFISFHIRNHLASHARQIKFGPIEREGSIGQSP